MSESAAAESRKDTIVSFVEGMHIYLFRRKDILFTPCSMSMVMQVVTRAY